MIRPEDQTRWSPYLLTGERLLWAGRPKLGLVLRWSDLYVIPLSLAWLGLALVSDLGRLLDSLSLLEGFWLVPFVLLGLYFVLGRFLVDAFIRARTHYAVASRRILILRSGRFGELRSVELDYLPMLDLEERGERGTIVFDTGPDPSPWRHDGPAHIPALDKGMRFYRIEQPRIVYDLVRRESERRRREVVGELPPHRAFIG
jgi:hypothetical protein